MRVIISSNYNFTSLHLVEPLQPSGVEVWQRACPIFLSCARDRACLQSTPFSSNAFWMLSCHLVRGLPLVLLPSYWAFHVMHGYLDSGILTTWLNQRSCIYWICDCRGFTFSAIQIVWLHTLSSSQPPGVYSNYNSIYCYIMKKIQYSIKWKYLTKKSSI
jgi:hypothetical protein